MVDLLGKIIYLCNELLFEKLFWIFGEHLHMQISRAFILAHCIKDLEYWSCMKEFSK